MTQTAPRKRTGRNTAKRGSGRARGGTTDATTTEGREARTEEQTAPTQEKPAGEEPSSEAAEAVTGLDMVLVDGARGPLRRLVPPARTTANFAKALAGKPDVVGKRARYLARELGRIGIGRSEIEPNKKDKRFADPAWSGNPLLHRVMQAHIATAQTAAKLVEDAELDWQDDERVRFTLTNIVDALAPSNTPLNPLLWKAVIDTGGKSAVRGVRRAVRDLVNPPRVPSMVDEDAFTVGEDLAVTPGAVVFRTDVFELIQYTPTTPQVRAVPLLMVPPTINKFYIADLAPGRSIVEHYVASGQQVFMISWRNPDERHADWGLDAYGQAVLDAMGAVEQATGSRTTSLQAFCSGGIITAMVLAHLAEQEQLDRIASASFAVTVLDWERAGTVGALMDPEAVREAVEKSRRKGYLDGAALAEVFAWLRPNDLVWNYWVNNYLQGKAPAAFDILFWNADTTRMSAGLHRDFIQLALDNALTKPGTATMLGTPVDLSTIDVDTYVTAGIADHLCPWQACYKTTQLLGGESRFILSTNGHIASLVNPPTNPKSTFQVAPSTPPSPDEWLSQAETTKGSWWPDYMAWLGERSGEEIPAPDRLGGNLEVLGDAPGTYVFDK
jgi:polyhydroxyalkanoate synthase